MKHRGGKEGNTRVKRPTVRDVARVAQVGTTTVSRVINGGHYVDAQTMARVHAAIEALGYQPSQAARALKGEKTHSIGIIVPTLDDPFFARTISAVQKIVRDRKMVLITLASEDDANQATLELKTFRGYRVDGLLVVPPAQQTRAFLAAVDELAVPTVTVDRPLTRKYPSVMCDNFEAARSAVEHLIGHGCRSILCFGGASELYTIRERVRGYQEAMRSAQLKIHVMTGMPNAEMRAALEQTFRDDASRPDGVFSLFGPATIAAYEYLTASPYELAKDVRLLGFDDFPLADTLKPAVSVVRQDVDELGRTAANLLFDAIENGSSGARNITVPSELVLRNSCGCPAEH